MSRVVQVPEASACAVSGSVSAPSCPGLDSRPWTSSFTVYTNNSIYKEITPEEIRIRGVLQTCDFFYIHSLAYFITSSTRGSEETSSGISLIKTTHRKTLIKFIYFITRLRHTPILATGLSQERYVPCCACYLPFKT